GLGNGAVDDFLNGRSALLAKVFTDAVHDDDRFVDRVAEHCQHASKHRQRELPLEEGKKAKNNDHVVQVGHNACYCKLPFKAQTQVDHDADDYKQKRQQSVGDELLANLRANEFHAAQL